MSPPERHAAPPAARMSRLAVGDLEVLAFCDGTGSFFESRSTAFPAATPESWRAADELDPGSVDRDGAWQLRFRMFGLRLPDGRVMLVDAGIGPADSPARSWTPVPGALPQLLAAAGVSRSSVDTVILTHLHSDHVGWAVVDGEPYFPAAQYVLQRSEYDAVRGPVPGA
ncbi:MAG: MBL fold metallo-hydrolase [Geodermatophilaceae bacterium]